MNLRELLNSNAKVVKDYSKDKGPYKDFRNCQLGGVIKVNTEERIDNRRGIRHMVMYMTTTLDSERANFIRQYAPHRMRFSLSTYTVALSFSNYYTLEIPIRELQNENDEDSTYFGLGDNLYHNSEFLNYSKAEAERLSKSDVFLSNKRKHDLVMKTLAKREDADAKKRFKVAEEAWNDYLRGELIKDRVQEWLIKHNDVRFLDHPYRIANISNNIVKIENVINLDTPVRVNCTCGQFYYTFAWYNADHKVLIGPKPPAYIENVDEGRRGLSVIKKRDKHSTTVRNKNKQPGICKHLQFFIAYLMQNEIIIAPKNASRQVRQVYRTVSAINKISEVQELSESPKMQGFKNVIEEVEGKDLYKVAKEERAKFNLEREFARTVTRDLLRERKNRK